MCLSSTLSVMIHTKHVAMGQGESETVIVTFVDGEPSGVGWGHWQLLMGQVVSRAPSSDRAG